MKRYSDALKSFAGDLSRDIQLSLDELQIYLEIPNLDILEWSERYIAIPITLDIELPARGACEIDIRPKEDILVLFDIRDYPYRAPIIKTDRLDFPKNQLSHLYVAKNGRPPSLCLLRGNIDNWFADKSIIDLVKIVETWYWKAAGDSLLEDNEQFDPVRLEGYSGINSYKYETLFNIVKSKSGINKAANFVITMQSFLDIEESGTSYQYNATVKEKDLTVFLEMVKIVNTGLDKQKNKEKLLFGIVSWSDNTDIISSYDVNFPSTYKSLTLFAQQLGIDIIPAIEYYIRNKLDLFDGIPLILGVKRPKNLIGYDGDIEFFHFVINAPREKTVDNSIVADAFVKFQSHREPLSVNKAREISGHDSSLGKTLMLGAGSLGSKIIMHLARSGHINQTVIDTEKFEPHNMVRHDLDQNSIGKLKANAMVDKIKGLFTGDPKVEELAGGNRNAINLLLDKNKKLINSCDWIIDTTASPLVLNVLAAAQLGDASICRCEMAEQGEIGMLFIEGIDRNPRVDDLIILTYAKSLEVLYLSEWLKSEKNLREGSQRLINVGVGCNSETMVMSDDLISNHASVFSCIIKSEAKRNYIQTDGLIFLNHIDQQGLPSIKSEHFIIKPLSVYQTKNKSEWEIRIKSGLSEMLQEQYKAAYPNETGGVLVGVANYKTKIVYVTDVILAPPDSKASPVCFIRGIQNLPKQIEEIKNTTGQMLGYVGEWHTHPHGPNAMSDTDRTTVIDLKIENDAIPIPTFLIIVSSEGILPFVF